MRPGDGDRGSKSGAKRWLTRVLILVFALVGFGVLAVLGMGVYFTYVFSVPTPEAVGETALAGSGRGTDIEDSTRITASSGNFEGKAEESPEKSVHRPQGGPVQSRSSDEDVRTEELVPIDPDWPLELREKCEQINQIYQWNIARLTALEEEWEAISCNDALKKLIGIQRSESKNYVLCMDVFNLLHKSTPHNNENHQISEDFRIALEMRDRFPKLHGDLPMRPQLVKKAVQFGEWEMAARLTWDWDTKVYYLRQIGGFRGFWEVTEVTFFRAYEAVESGFETFNDILRN